VNAARPCPPDSQHPRLQNRLRRVGGRAGAAFVVFALPVLMAGPARADLNAAPTLGGWNISADGNVVDILVDNATGLAGIHPLSEADFPAAQSQFQTGPFGSGLATLFWPGSAGGNFGSLSGELGFPSQLEPLASQLNDPVKASAQYPSGPQTARYPAGSSGGVAVMQSTAQAGGTNAEATITDESPSAVLSFSSAKGTSSATAASTALAQSSADISDVSILSGLVDIGSITSTAQSASDGSTGTGAAVTHVTGVTVMGQKASIGSDGLVLPNFPSTLGALTGPLVQNAISQVISGLGLTVTEFPSIESANGSGYTATSGGVSIEINPPSSAAPILEQAAANLAPFFPAQAAIIPTLPGLLQGLTVTITLGRATASANASPAFSVNFNPPPFTPATTPAGSGSGSDSFTAGGGGSVPVASTPGVSSTGPSPSVAVTPSSGSSATPGVTSAPVAQPAATLINLSSPLGAGATALGVLVALLAGFGLWRVARMLLPGDTEPVCPLGQDQP
jgi:hypothetical protein